MAKGRFSNPRPYREEEREIEQAFRQVTGQEKAPKPTPEAFPQPISDETTPVPDISALMHETAAPVPEGTHTMPDVTTAVPDLSAVRAQTLPPVSKPAESYPDFDDLYPEEEPEEEAFPSLLDRVLDFYDSNKKAVLVGLCAAALVLIVGVIAIFFVGSATDPYNGKILNNVTVAGVNVGGMTKSEAIAAVRQVTDNTFPKKDMVVQLGDTTLVFSPDDTGAELDVKAAVNAAYDYGRTGTKSEKQAAYDASLTGNHIIGLLPYLNLDEDYIKGVLEEYAGTVGSLLTQTTYELEGDVPALSTDKFSESSPTLTLVITMGTPGVNFDVDALYEEILDAYSLNRFAVERKDAAPDAEPEPIDLQAVYDEICVEPVDASVNMQNYETIPGSYGYTFDIAAAQRLVDKAEYGEVLRIEMEYVAPTILDDEVFFRDVLGECSTPHSNNANRTTNLKLACAAIDGLVLNPGETFSFNDTLGQRTAAKGYKEAPAYSGNELVDSLGGGICQVSSTLYCATLMADLETVSRSNHGFPVSYIDYGMDATVSWGSPDFKFRNTTNYPIQLHAEVSNGYVNIQILGTDEKDYYIEMSYVITNTYKPETEYVIYEADNAEGYKDGDVIQEGTTGYFVKTYKNKYNKETGAFISKDFAANSQYKTLNRIVVKIEEPETTAPETEPETPPPTVAPETTPSTEATAPTETTQPTQPSEPDPVPEESETPSSEPSEAFPAEGGENPIIEEETPAA